MQIRLLKLPLLLSHWGRVHTELVAMTICSMQLCSLLAQLTLLLHPDGCLVKLVSQRPSICAFENFYEVAPRKRYALASRGGSN